MSSPPAMPPEISINLMSSFGVILVGSFLSAALWGVSTFQTFLYFMTYETDPTFLKVLIASLWALDTANEVLIIKSNFRVDILHWGLVSGLNQQQLELMDHIVTEALVVLCVQLYFIWRIYIFSKKKWLFPAFLVVLSSWQIVGTVLYLAFGYGRPLSLLFTPRQTNINMSMRAAAVAVDISTTIGMVYLLSSQPSSPIHRSKRMINRLIMICINSGMVTAVAATATLILQLTLPDTLFFAIPELPIGSLYFSTFLANLNARHYVRGTLDKSGGVNTFSSLALKSVTPPNSSAGNKTDTRHSWRPRSANITTTTGATTHGFSSGAALENVLDLEGSDHSHENKSTKLVVKVQTESMMVDDASHPSKSSLASQAALVSFLNMTDFTQD